MPSYGQITGTDDGVEGNWLIELDDTGTPISEYAFTPVETLPDVVPVWSIKLPIGDDETWSSPRTKPRTSRSSRCCAAWPS